MPRPTGIWGWPGATLAATVYLIGARICHQQPERSFHPWGVQVPVCARCLGLYIGAPLGALAAWRRLRRVTVDGPGGPRRSRAVLALGLVAIPTAVTVVGEAAGLMAPADAVRAGLAVPLGAAVAAVLAWAVGGVWSDAPVAPPRHA